MPGKDAPWNSRRLVGVAALLAACASVDCALMRTGVSAAELENGPTREEGGEGDEPEGPLRVFSEAYDDALDDWRLYHEFEPLDFARYFATSYDENGIVFDSLIAGRVRPAYEALAQPRNQEALVRYFRGISAFSPPCMYIPALEALHAIAPDACRQEAERLLGRSVYKDGAPSCMGDMHPISVKKWPTLNRACFYVLLKDKEGAERAEFLAWVKRACSCPLVNADVELLGRANATERDYFLKHGDWPDPDEVPGCELFAAVKKRAAEMRAAVVARDDESRLDWERWRPVRVTMMFPDTPVFWFLRTLREARRGELAAKAIEAAEGWWFSEDGDPRAVWSEWAYLCLREERDLHQFRLLARSEKGLAQVLGTLGVIECLASEERPDFAEIDEALARTVYADHSRSDTGAYSGWVAVGDEVLGIIDDNWSPRRRLTFLEKHADRWFALLSGCRKPDAVQAGIIAHYLCGSMLRHPLGRVDNAVGKLVPLIERSTGSEWYRVNLIHYLAATRSESAFEWIQDRLDHLAERDRIDAIFGLRHFGKEKLNALSWDAAVWTEPERAALADAETAIARMERAQAILGGYREKRIPLDRAVLEMAHLRHDAVLPWIWEIARAHAAELAPETRELVKANLAHPVNSPLCVEGVIRVRLAMEGLVDW